MGFLSETELAVNYYPKTAGMVPKELTTYLQRANAFCKGEIGGVPPVIDDDLKVAVSMAFEIMAQGETAQIDDITGNITEAAPAGPYTRNKADDPLEVVRSMLRPYKIAFEKANAAHSDRSIMFI